MLTIRDELRRAEKALRDSSDLDSDTDKQRNAGVKRSKDEL